MAVLNDPLQNKGLAFPMHGQYYRRDYRQRVHHNNYVRTERDRLGIRGLLPPTVEENLNVQQFANISGTS